MAIYHFSAKIIRRSRGHSAVSAAAYRSATALRDERNGVRRDFTHKTDVIHSEILAPPHAPAALFDRERLWNLVEAGERLKTAQLAREVEFALPRELAPGEAIALSRSFVERTFVAHGMVADLNIHWDQAPDGAPKPHAHVLLTLRILADPADALAPFGLKAREWNRRALLRGWREAWADHANTRLAELGLETRIDHRALRDQALGLEPQDKIGPLDGRGDRNAHVERHRQIAWRNGQRLIADPALGLRALTHHQAAFDARQIKAFAKRHSGDPNQFERVVAALEGSKDLVRLGPDATGVLRFTSREMLETEVALERAAEALALRADHRVSRAGQAPALSGPARDPGAAAQRRSLRQLTQGPDLVLVAGYRQADRDSLLTMAREAWTTAGLSVVAASPTGQAAQALQARTGLEAEPLSRLQAAWEAGDRRPTANTVIVLDQAGLYGSRQLSAALQAIEAGGAKLIMVGDPGQLRAHEAGAAFRALAQRHGLVTLAEPRRQRVEWQHRAAQRLMAGQAQRAVRAYAAAGDVWLHRDATEAKAAILVDWSSWRQRHPDRSQIIVTATQAEARALTSLLRREARAIGALGPEVAIDTAMGSQRLARGDRVLFRTPAPDLGIAAGATGEITALNPTRIEIALDGGSRAAFAPSAYRDLEPGYAVSVSQAREIDVDRVHVLASPRLDRHGAYLALSRHRERATLHASREEFASLEALGASLSQERAKAMALDLAFTFAERRGLRSTPETPAHGRFEGLRLGGQPARPAPAPREAPRRPRLEAHLNALVEVARVRMSGQEPLPHQLAALTRSALRLDQAWPNASTLLRQVMGRDAALLQAALSGRFATVFTALLNASAAPKAGPGPRLHRARRPEHEPDGMEL